MDFIDGIENPSGLTVGKVSVTDKILDDILEGILDTEIGDVDKKEDKVFHIEYDVDSAKYNNSSIISADRYIATYVGDRTTPHVVDEKPVYRFSENFDNITVKLPQTSVEKETK